MGVGKGSSSRENLPDCMPRAEGQFVGRTDEEGAKAAAAIGIVNFDLLRSRAVPNWSAEQSRTALLHSPSVSSGVWRGERT